jgi:hypothetical protein
VRRSRQDAVDSRAGRAVHLLKALDRASISLMEHHMDAL